MTDSRVSVRMIEDDEGNPRARLMFSDVAFTVDPGAVSLVNGELRVQVPSWIDVPQDVVVVERWLPPTVEQARLAVEALDAAHIEALLIEEQQANPGEPWGYVARAAVARAVTDQAQSEDRAD